MNRFALTNSPFWRANFACDANARHCSLGFGAVLAVGTACTVFPAAGGTPNAGSVLGGSVLGGNGGKSPCCALTRSDVVEIATVAATLGQVAAQATVKSRNVLRGFRDFNATLLYRSKGIPNTLSGILFLTRNSQAQVLARKQIYSKW
jgi:hypothetical protein